jgi:hypothetical protein
LSTGDGTTAGIGERKRSHLDLCQHDEVEFQGKTTLFEEVDLIHDALPELAVADLDLTVEFLGKRLRAPLLITGMTGGTADAFAVNRDLASVAERCGIGFATRGPRGPSLYATTFPRVSCWPTSGSSKPERNQRTHCGNWCGASRRMPSVSI